MEFSAYYYFLVFPLTIPNVLWTALIFVLFISYVSTYIFLSKSIIGNFLKFLVEYGKYKTIFNRLDVPKSFFIHYYIVSFVWNAYCLYTVIRICNGSVTQNWIAELFLLHGGSYPKGDQLSIMIVLSMLTVHSLRRLFESLFVSVFSTKAKINLIQYLGGITYYIILAPTVISESLPLNGMPYGTVRKQHVFGIIGFCIASLMHHKSLVILANLRKKSKNAGPMRSWRGIIFQKDREYYGIPEGFLFDFVSCPHYLAEIFVYSSMFLVLYKQCMSWYLVMTYVWIAHLNMAAGAHAWYVDTFRSYPKNRRALIPFIY